MTSTTNLSTGFAIPMICPGRAWEINMFDKHFKILVLLLLNATVALVIAGAASFGSLEKSSFAAPAPTPSNPPYSSYKGVAIGTPMDEARAKLGTAKEKSDAQDFYVFSDSESVQVFYGPTKSVTAITVTFTGKVDAAPTAKAVFGEDVAPKPDGGIFKMVRYPKAGFWISYNKIAGDDPLVMIAMQKM